MSDLAAPVFPAGAGTGAVSSLVDLQGAARDYIRASKAPNTVRAYRRDWQAFEAWCRSRELEPMPAAPATIVLYLTQLAQQHKASTITRHAASISVAHQLAGHRPAPTQDPAVRDALRGIRRTLGTARAAKAAVTLAILRRLVASCDPATPAGIRDRALLLVGLASAMRRSELVAVDVEDLVEDEDGLTITLRRSKSDLEASGRKLAIPYGSHPDTCPIRALRAWLRHAGIESGPLWRPVDRHGRIGAGRVSDDAVAQIIKRAAERAGFDPAQFAGHSLRRGFATTAARNGAPERYIQRQTGHRSVVTLRAYVEDGTLFTESAAAYLGL